MMTEQESRDWSEFSHKVIDLIENETVEKSCNIPIANWTVEQCLAKLRAAVDNATVRQSSIETKQYEMVRIAYFAQLAFTKLKSETFDREEALKHLKDGNPVRPAKDKDLIILSCSSGQELSQFVSPGYFIGKGKTILSVPEQFLTLSPILGLKFINGLPFNITEWVLATQDEVDAITAQHWTNKAGEIE
jgi:hypothetical protein|nr:MAG TPA: hypothetical protein [Caudoviricetes sp.]